MSDTRWVITEQGGVSTLHKNPRERCRIGEHDRDVPIDEFSAERMLLYGDVLHCDTCMKEGWG